jgi:phenylacetate-CoA ligase
VYPSEIEAVLLADARVSPHYLLVLDGRGPASRLVVACEAGSSDVDNVTLGARLGHGLQERLGLRCDVRVLPSGTVPRVEVGKAVRVARWTGGAAPLPGLD